MPCRPRSLAQGYAAAAERLEHEVLLAEGAIVYAEVLLEHARADRLAARDVLEVVRPAVARAILSGLAGLSARWLRA